jgi:hypothetical protein
VENVAFIYMVKEQAKQETSMRAGSKQNLG